MESTETIDTNVTDSDIADLARCAGQGGDLEQVRLCEIALTGYTEGYEGDGQEGRSRQYNDREIAEARRKCEEAIVDARGRAG